MAQAKQGDRVKIHFTGRLDDGSVFDTTTGDSSCQCGDCGDENAPYELVIGNEEFFVPVEEALVGIAPGEKKKIVVSPEDAFGDYDDECVFTIERSQLPDDMQPEVGMELELTDEDDESVAVTVVDLTDTTVTFDANHPLAGEELTFDIELVEIV